MRTQRLLAPEVIQTSAMDCGPACLKSLLEGFGIPVSYDRLRDACQTDLDGTSVNTIEQVAVELGLEAEQIMVPQDHLLLPETKALPALVVVRLPTGLTHFVIVWRQYGGFLQIMDPATGRQWLAGTSFLDQLYIHAHSVSAADWREWATSDEFISALRRRARRLKLPGNVLSRLIDEAVADENWRSIAALDASVRMMRPIIESGGLGNGKAAGRVLAQFFQRVRLEPEKAFEVIPPAYWSVLPMKGASEGEEAQLVFRGAVLIRVRGRRPECTQRDVPEPQPSAAENLSSRLRPAVTSTLSELVRLLRADGLLAPTAVVSALIVAAGGLVFEALLYRILLDLTSVLTLSHQRLVALGMLLGFLGVLVVLDLLIGGQLLRFGRHLELRLRTFLLQKLPRLSDRYFGSRLVSDMAERSHAIHEIRMLPVLGGQLIHHAFELALTTIGIICLDPHIAPLVIAAALCAVALPLAAQPVIAERDLRLRTHSGGLARFYFDALRGLIALRTHGAEEAIKTEHEGHLVNWSRAGLGLQRIATVLEGVTLVFGTVLTAWILLSHIGRHADSTVGLLLVYWTLNIPVLGRQLAEAALQYPKLRNLTARLIEPLALPDNSGTSGENTAAAPAGSGHLTKARPDSSKDLGVSIAFKNASIRAIGQTIVEEFSLTIEPGSHVCIVGLSGAGKSSLVGLLLGWHKPATGRILIDGQPLDEAALRSLRRQTVWVDPAIQIWNRSLLENLQYGAGEDLPPIGQAIEEADLLSLLETLPDGLQTRLGESGALVSGGEGQRVRLGRALLRRSSRLVILDEPFASLDREKRQELLRRAKRMWRNATLICVTHDVSESRHFERVLVMEQGRILEDGAPAVLSSQRSSRFRQLLDSEESVQREVWGRYAWRTIRLDQKQIVESIGTRHDEERFRDDVLASAALGRSSTNAGAERGTSSKVR